MSIIIKTPIRLITGNNLSPIQQPQRHRHKNLLTFSVPFPRHPHHHFSHFWYKTLTSTAVVAGIKPDKI
ncbi:hypothetical protein Hanom_Chr04g00315191 [Helianthus anomalus]